jgi:hypothetical protein
MSANEPSSPTIPLHDSQIIFLRGVPHGDPWRVRLAPFRRWLFVAAIVVGGACGAGVYFATHDAPTRAERK